MHIDELLENGWTTFADTHGNHGYITRSTHPLLVLICDDDAIHCLGGRGYSWKAYGGDVFPDIDDIAYDISADEAAYGLESFEEALANLEKYCQVGRSTSFANQQDSN